METNKYSHAHNPSTEPQSIAFNDVETFVFQRKQLFGLLGDLQERRAKISRGDQWLVQRIKDVRERCKKLAETDPRIAALWRLAEADLQIRFADLWK